MSLVGVFRQDLLDIRNSRLFWMVLIVCPLLTIGSFYGVMATMPAQNRSALFGVFGMTFPVLFFVPIVALMAASSAIARERESGTIRYLLGLPNARWEVVLGKFFSRAVLVGGGFSVGFIGVAAFSVALFDRPRLLMLVVFALLTALFASGYVGLAVGISAVADSQMRAITGAVGSYLVWAFFWLPFVPSSAPSLAENYAGVTGESLALFEAISPSMAFAHSLQLLGPMAERLAKTMTSESVLISPIVAVGVLLAWTVVPLAVGYWRFRSAEIT